MKATRAYTSKRRLAAIGTIGLMALLAMLGGEPRPAGAAESRQEQGKALVEKSLAALGGEAFLNVKNMVQEGRAYSFYRQDLSGLAVFTRYELYEPMIENPSADWLPLSRRDVYTEKGDYYALYPHGEGWEVTFRGARPFPEERMQQYRESVRRNYFYFLRYRLQEPDLYYYSKGTEILSNVPTHAVDITDAEGETITVYLQMSDFLPVQQVYLRRDPKTRVPYEEKSIYSKYREVDGVTIPWNIRQERNGQKTFEFFGRTALINQQLDQGLFELGGKVPRLDPLN